MDPYICIGLEHAKIGYTRSYGSYLLKANPYNEIAPWKIPEWSYEFTITTPNVLPYVFWADSEDGRLRWVELLEVLSMYPFSPIPKQPKISPIKDSFRKSFNAETYGAGKLQEELGIIITTFSTSV